MLHQVKSYVNYKKNSVGKHGVHSPFVFDLMRQVFDKEDNFYAFKFIEKIRESLKLDNTILQIEDFGAGSKTNTSNKRTVRQLIKTSAKAPKYGQLLFRLANYFEVENIIELGTSLGMSTLYLANSRRYADLYTLEGSAEIAKKAKDNFNKMQLNSIKIITGNFDDTLTPLLDKLEKIDFVFFDGNHKEEPTLQYFEKCLTKIHNNTIFVFDDIYWSKEMTSAWQTIKANKRVTITLDIFEMGIVFFRKELPKQDLIINY